VLGAIGMLGSDVVIELGERGHEALTPSIKECDITDPTSVAACLDKAKPEWCVNCAAYTAVDKAETERKEAAEINALGPGYLARACAMLQVKLLHVSTDFVFDGEATEPYSEDAQTHPLGYYGQSKLEGEEGVLAGLPSALIVRTAWLYGPNGGSFPRTMIRAWEAGKSLRVVADQTGCPTYTGDLARVLVDMAEKDAFPGIYHAVGPEAMTWHEFALRAIQCWAALKGYERPVEIEPIPTEAYPTPAKRPKYSVLSTEKLANEGVTLMRPVGEALSEFCERGSRIEGWA